MVNKIKRLLFILKGKTIGYSPSGDYEDYKRYIVEGSVHFGNKTVKPKAKVKLYKENKNGNHRKNSRT